MSFTGQTGHLPLAETMSSPPQGLGPGTRSLHRTVAKPGAPSRRHHFPGGACSRARSCQTQAWMPGEKSAASMSIACIAHMFA